ncbi:MAG TPA: hypothetical protein VNI57_07965 [Candidatus Saccharimonadales bacterium]|nr:hypothetical protein [Candidatus Saccharimonadales bacterium]
MSLRKPGLFAPLLAALTLALVVTSPALAADKEKGKEDEGPLSAKTFAGLELRNIGPAVTSGRITDIAVNPTDRSRYYVASASGGVWKTDNDGTTWTPLFDAEGSYSIGCVTIDPHNPLTVWVGTGENNSQRSVSYGDGVYKSVDGGTSWKKMGLEKSEHIAKILVDPRKSDTVFVAAQGPLWNSGGDRGLYKTTDGGKTWKQVLKISDETGVNDVTLDPRHPDVMLASAYQRRRHVWTLIDGGPESGIYKSMDGGETWDKVTAGLPTVDMGRIGLAVSPANPDVVYAIVEAEGDKGGFFRSTDMGSNWTKMGDYMSSSPQYYNEIIADPKNVDRVYAMDTWMMVTQDGGKTFARVGEKTKHVDNHVLWIDPENTDYLLAGCDGGVYESYDRGATWRFKENLPVTQFYRATPDNTKPFYYVYGGTQDNNTLGGPSRNTSSNGIVNSDWYVSMGGDGFQTRIDPENPDIVYSEAQYGILGRFDRKSGEILYIQPQEAPGEAPLKWNWDSPLIVSPHSHTRLYFAAQKVFRTDDRGDTWKAISGDLTRKIDRNTLKIMGKIQPPDAVAKGSSTSYYGNVVSLSESPMTEGLLYAGTDDGLVQVLEPGQTEWRRIEKFPGVPEMTYVSDLEASYVVPDRVYAAFDNHKKGDYKPYLLRSDDRGATWTSIAGNLPESQTVYTIAEDNVNGDLLFAGTEYGLYFTIDGGQKWVRLKGGMPTIAVRDLEIQRREGDLVVGSFGRGILILDDYSPLRTVTEKMLGEDAHLFPIKQALMYMPSTPLGLPGKSFQGDTYFSAPNPPFGAVITYYLKDDLKTLTEQRHDAEKKAIKDKAAPPPYPSLEDLRKEMREEKPEIVLTVKDSDGEIVRRLTAPTKAGIHRVAWDLRYPDSEPVQLKPPAFVSPFSSTPQGPMALPGEYTVTLEKESGGEYTPLGEPQKVEAMPLGLGTLAAKDKETLLAFEKKVARLQRAVLGAVEIAKEAQDRIDHLQKAVLQTPGADLAFSSELLSLQNRLKDIRVKLTGDPVRSKYEEPQTPSIRGRVDQIVETQWASTSPITQTNRDAYRYAGDAFGPVLSDLRTLVETDLKGIEDRMEAAGAPYTPGRVPRWTME